MEAKFIGPSPNKIRFIAAFNYCMFALTPLAFLLKHIAKRQSFSATYDLLNHCVNRAAYQSHTHSIENQPQWPGLQYHWYVTVL